MSVKVIGLDKALADLDKKGDAVIEAVKDALSSAATDIEIEAIRNAPSTFEGLPLNIKQRIDKIADDGGLTWRVGIQSGDPVFEIEAWLEFGTGLSAREILSNPVYTQEVRDVARRFYRNGRGRIIGQPFLMPAFFRNTANLVSDIEAEINKDIK
jgi:HK97 gp10 family phage protein